MIAVNSNLVKEILATTLDEKKNTIAHLPKISFENSEETNVSITFPTNNNTLLETDAAMSEDELTSRDILYVAACKEMLNYAKCYIKESLHVIQPTINKLNAVPKKSDVLKIRIEELQGIVDKITSLNMNDETMIEEDVYAITREMKKVEDSFLSFYQSDQHEKETYLLQKILMEIDIKAAEERVRSARRLLVENFAKAYGHFDTTVNERERRLEWELIEFYKRFTIESNMEKKFEMFNDFWAIFY